MQDAIADEKFWWEKQAPGCPWSRLSDFTEREVRTEVGGPQKQREDTLAFHFLLMAINVNTCFSQWACWNLRFWAVHSSKPTIRTVKNPLPSNWSKELRRTEHPFLDKNHPGPSYLTEAGYNKHGGEEWGSLLPEAFPEARFSPCCRSWRLSSKFVHPALIGPDRPSLHSPFS